MSRLGLNAQPRHTQESLRIISHRKKYVPPHDHPGALSTSGHKKLLTLNASGRFNRQSKSELAAAFLAHPSPRNPSVWIFLLRDQPAVGLIERPGEPPESLRQWNDVVTCRHHQKLQNISKQLLQLELLCRYGITARRLHPSSTASAAHA